MGQAEAEEAQMFIYHMLDKGVEPDVTSYTFLLEGLCQEDKIEAPFELYYKYVEQDIIHARDMLLFILSLCMKGHLMAASKLLFCSLNHDIGCAESHVIFVE